MFSVGFIALLLVKKFVLGRPLQRIVLLLGMRGLRVSPGTLVGVLGRVLLLPRPLYTEIVAYNRTETYLHADETGWKLFDPETRRRWWVWAFVGKVTVAFMIKPARSGIVVRRHLGVAGGKFRILISDFFAAYKRSSLKSSFRTPGPNSTSTSSSS